MRRILTLLLILVMAFSVSFGFSACSRNDDTPDTPNIEEIPGGDGPEQGGGDGPEQGGGDGPEQGGGDGPEQGGGDDPEQGGDDPEQGGGDDPEQGGGDDPEQGGGDDPEQGGGDDPEQGGGDDPEQGGGDDPEQGGGDDPEQGGGDDPEQGGGDDPEQGGGDDPEQGGGDEPTQVESSELPHYDYSAGSGNVYNKELFYKNDYDIALGDPTVFFQRENGVGWYYVTGTTSGKDYKLWKTKNFSDWIDLGVIYTPPSDFFGKGSFWAPQLYHDPNADWQYYLGESAGKGKGLYMLFYSARISASDGTKPCYVAVAFSKNVDGPYTNFTGTNANGDAITPANPLFDLEKIKGLGLGDGTAYGSLYKAGRGFIDASPYVDPVTGEKYLYFVKGRYVGDKSNDVWGVKLKDWVTPDYSTTKALTSFGYTTVERNEKYNFTTQKGNLIDEGPFMYYKDLTDDGIDNGKYYLTLSLGDTNDKLYPVIQAIGDSPLGPFTKVQPEDDGMIVCPEAEVDIHGSGHHCFFEVDGELFVASHTYIITTGASFAGRYFTFCKVEWVQNEKGQNVMRANGPHKTIQPLPNVTTGYRNVAQLASVSATGENVNMLNDGLVALNDDDIAKEFSTSTESVITMTFPSYVTARAILIYNSYDYEKSFDNIDKIEFSYRKEINGKIYTGTAVINDLGFNYAHHLVPTTYLTAVGSKKTNMLRPMSASIAEFNELEINAVKIYLKPREGKSVVNVSEIMILGKTNNALDGSKLPSGGSITHEFDKYTEFQGTNVKLDDVVIDGVLDEAWWTECTDVFEIAGATVDQTTKEEIDINVYGERNAKVYARVGENAIYYAFEVQDKNLFYNSGRTQSRNTGIEIYMSGLNHTALTSGCYSIRVSPTGSDYVHQYLLGTHIPTSAGNGWQASSSLPEIMVAVKVNGKVKTSADDTSSNADNVGYVVEIAIDKSILGDSTDGFKFSAAFVQAKDFDGARLNNTFITGTNHLDPNKWISVYAPDVNDETVTE